MVRPTIKQQQMLAQKSRKTNPKLSTESTDTPEPSTDTPESSRKRDKQVTVKFSENDMERLKAAASKARRPVANLIYSLTMDYVENSED